MYNNEKEEEKNTSILLKI